MPTEIKVTDILAAIEHWYKGTGTLSDVGYQMNIPAKSFMEVMVEQGLCTPDYHPNELVSPEAFIHALLLVMLLHERNARSKSRRQK